MLSLLEHVNSEPKPAQESQESINFTPDMLARLKRTYKAAEAVQADTFIFEGRTFVLGYAKYLIEYLEEVFRKQ
jgi:hypothetical protein